MDPPIKKKRKKVSTYNMTYIPYMLQKCKSHGQQLLETINKYSLKRVHEKVKYVRLII